MAETYIQRGIDRYLEENMTHVSREQILKENKQDPNDYTRIHLEVFESKTDAKGKKRELNFVSYSLRRKLAEKALDSHCEYVSDMFCHDVDGSIRMVASGHRKKTGFR